MLAETVATVTTFAALGSLIFAGVQTRGLVTQIRLSNQLASTNTTREAIRHLHESLSIFVDSPELRPYFCGGAQPPSDLLERERVDALAEMLADCIEASLSAARELPVFGSANEGDWEAYATRLFRSSPALRHFVGQGEDWPILSSLLDSLGVAGNPDRPGAASAT